MLGIRRRQFVTLLGGAAAAWPLAGHAQALAKRPRITFIGGSSPKPSAKITGAFIGGMRALGYTEGRDFEMEQRTLGEIVVDRVNDSQCTHVGIE